MQEIIVDLNLKPSQITESFGRQLVSTIFQFLLHSRSQIPFSFEIFKKFIEDKKDSNDKKNDWKAEKQIQNAISTLSGIDKTKEVLESQFCAGLPVFFIFGKTIQTPKESYKITFPMTNENSINDHSKSSLEIEIRKILLNIIQNDLLKTSENEPLAATNVFLIFKRSHPIEDHPDLKQLSNFKLSKSCKQLSIKFQDTSSFEIFEESFQELKLNDHQETEINTEYWYQSKNFVKGFNEILVNTKSISS